jgi:hypothetical protein
METDDIKTPSIVERLRTEVLEVILVNSSHRSVTEGLSCDSDGDEPMLNLPKECCGE